MNFIKKNLSKISLSAMALGLMAMPFASKASDFDATDTQSIITTALGNVTPTLKTGIIAVLGIGLGIWVVFFLVGKLKKHTK